MSTPSTPAPASTAIPAPAALARTLEEGMLAKATMPRGRMFLLSLTGGAYIALGFVFMVTSQQGMGDWPVGISKVIGGVAFSVGLGLVVVSGSDLFTGTTMTAMPWLSRRITTGQMLAHWGISIAGNLVGSLTVALLIFLAGTPSTNGSAWGLVVLTTTEAKVTHSWGQSFVLGILANLAVCLAVWVSIAGKTVADKVLAVAGPIALFVATGFEHSVANMFMLPLGLLVKNAEGDAFWQGEVITAAGVTKADFAAITAGHALWDNLVPVLLGNVVGGAVLVAAYFWAAYRRDEVTAGAGTAAAPATEQASTDSRGRAS